MNEMIESDLSLLINKLIFYLQKDSSFGRATAVGQSYYGHTLIYEGGGVIEVCFFK